ncbi:DUF4254 domain-containing protein [Nocardia sp. NBC_00511]|uniref:DUF4254 domain-containing protein n=1 Tax=Nocardia sp. NBC_00511 TaxID=2903591 RepID=UPI0030DE72FE
MDLFPARNRLLAACWGGAGENHPLLEWAGELSGIHQRRLSRPDQVADAEVERRRVAAIREIDSWVARQLPRSLGCARLHTETVGMVIDRLAQLSACAFVELSGAGIGLCETWERLAELAIGYEDLKDELTCGRRRLPCAPGEIRRV